MKRFIKAIAAFCAMAMIFGVFSATVFADENEPQAEQPVAEEVAEEEKQDEEAVAEEPAVETPAAEDPATEDPAAEESEADAEAPAQDSEQPVVEETLEVADVEGQEAVNEGEGNEEVPQQAIPPFANGQITQDDIDANGGKMPETAGTYTLAEDVEVPNSAHITAAGSSVIINLAGNQITYTGTENLYTIGFVEDVNIDGTDWVLVHGDISLTIKDTVGEGLITASQKTKGSDDHWISINTVNGVNYPNHGTEANKRGGCILVQNSCTLYLEGGTISGFHSQSDGGAVHISNGGHCVMSGGRITNCHSDSIKPNDDGAGAISCHCTSKGTEVGHTLYKSSEDADPVETTISLKGSLKITGGQIDNCSGRQGGAVRVLRADLEITGGTIEDNTAGANGGGILFTKGNTGTFKISGDPVISGNHCSDAKKANVWLSDNVTVTLSGNLSSDAKIEFGGGNTTKNFFNTNGKSYSIDSFISNHDGYKAYVSGSYIKLKQVIMPKVLGYNLLIGGEIAVKVSLQLGEYNTSDTTVNYSYSYDKNGTVKNIEKTLTFYQLTNGGDHYYFYLPVESACMTSEITVTINYANGEASASSSVVECANYIINHETDQNYTAEAKAVAKSLIYFGSCAQLQFNINTDNMPANAVPADPFYTYTGASNSPDQDPDSAYYGTSVSFVSMTTINMYFKKSVFGDTAPTMTVSYNGGGSQTITATPNGNYYMYSIKGPSGNGFAATEVDLDFTYSVGNVNGTYSIFTYLQVVKDKYEGSSGNVLLKLTEAYYDFAMKCLDYKNSVA